MQMFDPYAVLGVPRSATDASIKAAYRNRARMTHPDRGGEPAEFMVVVRAFGVLSDPAARRLFDETGEIREEGARDRRQQVAEILAEMFDTAVTTALSLRLPLQRVDFIAQLVTAVKKRATETEAGLGRIEADIAALRALRDRIRRHDGKRNLFAERLDQQLAAKEAERRQALTSRGLLETALTELANYDSEVELFSALELDPAEPAVGG